MSKYWSNRVHKLEPYVPGEQSAQPDIIKLNTNENPFPPSPAAITAIKDGAGDSLRLYPDPNAQHLKDAIASYYQLDSKNVFVGNGSDEVLAHIFCAFFQQSKPILFPDITYSFYPVYANLYGVPFRQVPLTNSFEINLDEYSIANGGIIFPNPNAPTGVGLPLSKIEALLKKNPDSVVVVDEAYVDFGAESAVSLIGKYPQLLVTQTLSKSRSLAGLRVGFAMGSSELIDGLERVKNSFNSYPLGRLAIVGAVESIRDKKYFEETRAAVMANRDRMCVELAALGFEVLPSQANFVFVRHPEVAAAVLTKKLREQLVLVRHFSSERIADYLRITVGTDTQINALIVALKAILEEL